MARYLLAVAVLVTTLLPVDVSPEVSTNLIGLQLDRPIQFSPGTFSPVTTVPNQIPGTFVSPERIGEVLGKLKPNQKLATRGAREAAVYALTSPSVVLVVTDSGFGSGSLISKTGDILTNWHVVEGVQEVGIVFKPPQEGEQVTSQDVRRAQVTKVDEVADLALVRVASVPEGRSPIEIGTQDRVVVGADVHAIGHPTGEAWTYTRGFVSQVRLEYEWRTESLTNHKADVIQTQTPINPGSSGGPLLDDDGLLIGVNAFTAQGEGMNFAVAVREVEEFRARPKSRYSETISRPTENAIDDCEPELLGTEQTTLGGEAGELGWLDADCDGVPDFQIFAPTDEGEPVVLLIDRSGDGSIDTLYFDDDRDGDYETSLYDTDGDGEPDLVGYHKEGEIEPYRIERVGP